MSRKRELFARVSRASVAGATLATLIVAGGGAELAAQNSTITVNGERQAMTTQSKFYCNIKALTPAERARHKELSDKLMAAKDATVETQNGYEFQYSPAEVSLAEVAEWAVAESKCCPFFDFHIDLEKAGTLIWLQLTGSEGVKQFMRAEFGIR
jgi:hypothetical protein